jgi:hypothetical protein
VIQDGTGRRMTVGRGASRDGSTGASNERPGAQVPGRATLTERLPPAPAGVVDDRVLRGARGALSRARVMTSQLRAAIAENSYLDAGHLAFEIRTAIQRAERELARLGGREPGLRAAAVSASARLARYRGDIAALLAQAPQIELAGAGTEPAEQAWRARAALRSGSWSAEASAIGGHGAGTQSTVDGSPLAAVIPLHGGGTRRRPAIERELHRHLAQLAARDLASVLAADAPGQPSERGAGVSEFEQ